MQQVFGINWPLSHNFVDINVCLYEVRFMKMSEIVTFIANNGKEKVIFLRIQ